MSKPTKNDVVFDEEIGVEEISAPVKPKIEIKADHNPIISIITLCDYCKVKGVDKLELTSTMAYYMNSLKSKSTLYGFSLLPTPNQSVQRNIVV